MYGKGFGQCPGSYCPYDCLVYLVIHVSIPFEITSRVELCLESYSNTDNYLGNNIPLFMRSIIDRNIHVLLKLVNQNFQEVLVSPPFALIGRA